MQKLTAHDPETKTPDLVAHNVAKLRALFPELLTEGQDGVAVNLDVLKQLVGDKTVTDAEEKYGLNWHGKRRARQLALTPSTGTLRPCPEDSVDWDTTQNLMIEGDNLEVLKLLQKSYAGKVKLIYIDPPYNTGKDFVYPDNFQDNIKNYLELTGQTGEGGKKLSSNTEASGRFHTDWLNMMYPRLKLAWNLLREDGLIMLSIDDHELTNLRRLGDEVFGEESFLITFVWQRRQMADSRNEDRASSDHEYVVCYKKAGAKLKGNPIDRDKYSNPDNDPRGAWFSADLTGIANREERPNLHYNVVNPKTGLEYPPSPTRGWSCAPTTMEKLIAEDRVLWPQKPDGRPRFKKFLEEITRLETGFSSWLDDVGNTTEGTRIIQELFGEKIFPFSKPVSLLSKLTEQGTPEKDGIVLDFFAGSGTTAHSVISQNVVDSGKRRYILVQLPEKTDRADYPTIADITKERLRRAGKKIRDENPLFAGDLGFRVFKLASSNIRAWEPDRENLAETLEASVEHLKTDRTEKDILFELLLKLGLDLCVPIETRKIAGHEVHSIGAGTLLACLSKSIPQADVEPLAAGLVAWHKEESPSGEATVVFRDSAFADDVAKTNLAAILKQNGLETVRSL
jgi:adenine-specific DNA-methyltransferase